MQLMWPGILLSDSLPLLKFLGRGSLLTLLLKENKEEERKEETTEEILEENGLRHQEAVQKVVFLEAEVTQWRATTRTLW